MILNEDLKKIIRLVAIETNQPEAKVEVIYRTYWKFIRDVFENLDFNSINTKEEFDKLRTSINLPSLGKICIKWEKIEKYRKRKMYLDNMFKEK